MWRRAQGCVPASLGRHASLSNQTAKIWRIIGCWEAVFRTLLPAGRPRPAMTTDRGEEKRMTEIPPSYYQIAPLGLFLTLWPTSVFLAANLPAQTLATPGIDWLDPRWSPRLGPILLVIGLSDRKGRAGVNQNARGCNPWQRRFLWLARSGKKGRGQQWGLLSGGSSCQAAANQGGRWKRLRGGPAVSVEDGRRARSTRRRFARRGGRILPGWGPARSGNFAWCSFSLSPSTPPPVSPGASSPSSDLKRVARGFGPEGFGPTRGGAGSLRWRRCLDTRLHSYLCLRCFTRSVEVVLALRGLQSAWAWSSSMKGLAKRFP